MRTKPIYVMIFFAFLITACGGGSDNIIYDEYVRSRDFTFNSSVLPMTLTQEDSFYLYSIINSIAPKPEAYAIESIEDLEVFNQTHTSDEDEYISLTDLDTHSYFFIRDPGCPDYFEYFEHSYNSNVLTITLDHFHEPNLVCPAIINELYLVFKARKSS